MIIIEEIIKGDNIEDFIIQFNPDNSELIVVGASSDEDGITGIFFTISGSIVDENIYGTSTSITLEEVRLNENEPDLYEENYTTLVLNGIMGDLNSDNSLNVLDIVITANIILELIEPTEYQLWAADINGDGSGLLDYHGLKLNFRGMLFDFVMDDSCIRFTIDKNVKDDTKRIPRAACMSSPSGHLSGEITYSIEGKKIVLKSVKLERGNHGCWPPQKVMII